MYRYALAMCGSAVMAEDIAHTALAEEYWVGLGRPAPRSRRKRLIDIAHRVCSRRLEEGAERHAQATACPEPELALTRRVDGRLPWRQRRALVGHLRICRDCAALVDELQAQRAALRELAELPVPASLEAAERSSASLRRGRRLIS